MLRAVTVMYGVAVGFGLCAPAEMMETEMGVGGVNGTIFRRSSPHRTIVAETKACGLDARACTWDPAGAKCVEINSEWQEEVAFEETMESDSCSKLPLRLAKAQVGSKYNVYGCQELDEYCKISARLLPQEKCKRWGQEIGPGGCKQALATEVCCLIRVNHSEKCKALPEGDRQYCGMWAEKNGEETPDLGSEMVPMPAHADDEWLAADMLSCLDKSDMSTDSEWRCFMSRCMAGRDRIRSMFYGDVFKSPYKPPNLKSMNPKNDGDECKKQYEENHWDVLPVTTKYTGDEEA